MSDFEKAPQPVTMCGQCGLTLPADEVLQMGPLSVCAVCKPAYLQRLREGLIPAAGPKLRYGGFWIRGLALLLETILLFVLSGMIDLALGATWAETFSFQNDDEFEIEDISLLRITLESTGWMIVSALMMGRWGGTPGKLLLRLRVVDREGRPLSYRRAFGRSTVTLLTLAPWSTVFFFDTSDEQTKVMAFLLCWAPYMVGMLIAAFDHQKRALHDHLFGTRVIYRPARQEEPR